MARTRLADEPSSRTALRPTWNPASQPRRVGGGRLHGAWLTLSMKKSNMMLARRIMSPTTSAVRKGDTPTSQNNVEE